MDLAILRRTRPEHSFNSGLTAFVTKIRLYNDGLSGTAHDWRVSIQKPSGERIDCTALPLGHEEFRGRNGPLVGPFLKRETIAVKSQKRIDTGDYVTGFYYGALPKGYTIEDIPIGSTMTIECQDQHDRHVSNTNPLPRTDFPWFGNYDMNGLPAFRISVPLPVEDWTEEEIQAEDKRLQEHDQRLRAARGKPLPTGQNTLFPFST